MAPSAWRSAIWCRWSSNSLIRASLRVNSGNVLVSCYSMLILFLLSDFPRGRYTRKLHSKVNLLVRCSLLPLSLVAPFYQPGEGGKIPGCSHAEDEMRCSCL